MKVQIDCYGFESSSEWFHRRKLEAYLIKSDGGIVYACFGKMNPQPIHRIDKDPDGCVRVMWAYGNWDEAEDLKYIPINETMNIEKEEVEE